MKLIHVRSLEWEAVYLDGVLEHQEFSVNMFPWRDLKRTEKWVDEAKFGGFTKLIVDLELE